MPCHEDTQVVLWRGPHREEPRTSASSKPPLARCMSQPHWRRSSSSSPAQPLRGGTNDPNFIKVNPFPPKPLVLSSPSAWEHFWEFCHCFPAYSPPTATIALGPQPTNGPHFPQGPQPLLPPAALPSLFPSDKITSFCFLCSYHKIQ